MKWLVLVETMYLKNWILWSKLSLTYPDVLRPWKSTRKREGLHLRTAPPPLIPGGPGSSRRPLTRPHTWQNKSVRGLPRDWGSFQHTTRSPQRRTTHLMRSSRSTERNGRGWNQVCIVLGLPSWWGRSPGYMRWCTPSMVKQLLTRISLFLYLFRAISSPWIARIAVSSTGWFNIWKTWCLTQRNTWMGQNTCFSWYLDEPDWTG